MRQGEGKRTREELLLLDVLQAVEHNGNQNDDAGEDELQVGINTEGGQGAAMASISQPCP